MPVAPQSTLFYTMFKSPLGNIGLAASQRGLRFVALRAKSEADFLRQLSPQCKSKPIKNPSALRPYQTQLEQYFSGRRSTFNLPLDFGLQASSFQKRVWRALRGIPYGQTRNYQWLARAVGQPRAARAVGNANGSNPLPIVVPCHRVIRKNGELGGYSSGVNRKRLLLTLEEKGSGNNGTL